MNKVLVSPIAYNEHIKLKNVIERCIKSSVFGNVDFLVIDDASDDGTTDVINSYKNQGIKTIKHQARSGVGAGIRTAIKYAQQNGYDVLVIMAGNDKDDPQEIPLLIDPILKDGYDFIQGSRYIGQSRIGGDMPFYRKVATKMHPWLLSLISGAKVTDSTNGFRAFRLEYLNHPEINIDQSWLDKYELEPYLLYKAIKLKFKFGEAPVTKIYPSKKLGYTKMKPLTGWWSILRPLFYLGLGIKK